MSSPEANVASAKPAAPLGDKVPLTIVLPAPELARAELGRRLRTSVTELTTPSGVPSANAVPGAETAVAVRPPPSLINPMAAEPSLRKVTPSGNATRTWAPGSAPSITLTIMRMRTTSPTVTGTVSMTSGTIVLPLSGWVAASEVCTIVSAEAAYNKPE